MIGTVRVREYLNGELKSDKTFPQNATDLNMAFLEWSATVSTVVPSELFVRFDFDPPLIPVPAVESEVPHEQN